MREVLKCAVVVCLVQTLTPAWNTRAATLPESSNISGVPVYATADENASVIAMLAAGETPTPIAESRIAGGKRWYLVKTRSGVLGWLKDADNKQSKSVQRFFRSLPFEAGNIAVESRTDTAVGRDGVVPVTIYGRAVVVPVTFNHSITANLLLDTGASMTIVSRRVATALALPIAGTARLSGIGGTVNTSIIRVASVKVSDVEVSDMAVSVHDVSKSSGFEGLLGMDFLSRFQVSVDSEKKLLLLSPK